MDIETTLQCLSAIAVCSGIGFVALLALAHAPDAASEPEPERVAPRHD